MSHTITFQPLSLKGHSIMNTVISRHRKAVIGIAATLMLAATVAFGIGVVAPDFASSFSANASEVVKGEKSAVTLVIEKSESRVGVLKGE